MQTKNTNFLNLNPGQEQVPLLQLWPTSTFPILKHLELACATPQQSYHYLLCLNPFQGCINDMLMPKLVESPGITLKLPLFFLFVFKKALITRAYPGKPRFLCYLHFYLTQFSSKTVFFKAVQPFLLQIHQTTYQTFFYVLLGKIA